MRYLSLTKPGIIFGNIITFLGGYFLDFHGYFDFISFVASLVGMALVIACGCVINNFVDRDIDRLMQRTNSPREAEGLALTAYEMVELLARQATMEIRSGALVCRTLWFLSISR